MIRGRVASGRLFFLFFGLNVFSVNVLVLDVEIFVKLILVIVKVELVSVDLVRGVALLSRDLDEVQPVLPPRLLRRLAEHDTLAIHRTARRERRLVGGVGDIGRRPRAIVGRLRALR
ncbi:MAG TPA: hypothetical protein VMT79_15690 [Candidatus Binatia bacterium]|nr:hypothetical protein [Candidatus Binatia bacterium]